MMIGATELANHLKKNYSELKIGFIGSHVSALPEEVITLSYVDFVFINEGVLSLLSLLKTNLKNNLEKVPGIWFRDSDGKPKKGKSGQIITNEQMDIMMPGYAWDLLPKNNKTLDKYRAHFWHSNFSPVAMHLPERTLFFIFSILTNFILFRFNFIFGLLTVEASLTMITWNSAFRL